MWTERKSDKTVMDAVRAAMADTTEPQILRAIMERNADGLDLLPHQVRWLINQAEQLNAATPLPADAALIGKLRHQLAQATDEAARLRALSQPEVAQVPEAINAVYFDVPANPKSAYVMGWNDCRESLLSAAPSAKGGE